MLDRQPTLCGPTAELRPLSKDDWHALYAVASDPLIWEAHPAHDRWQEPVFRDFFADALAHAGALAVIDRANGRIIGSSRYQNYRSDNGGSVEIGWTFIAREYWGGATNRELKRLMVGHALASIAECRFAVGEDNIRSRKAMEKIGGVVTDRTEERPTASHCSKRVIYTIGPAEFAANLARA